VREILTLDPSLTCTGWCIADEGAGPENIVVRRASRIVPDRQIPTSDVPGRVRSVVSQVQHLIVEHLFNEIDHLIVIELPSYRKMARHRGNGSGLALYGFLVGSVWQMCELISGRVRCVTSDKWTGGRSKEKRRKNACRYYKHLSKIKDPGFDVSDAVSLAIWWCQIGRRGETWARQKSKHA